MDRFRDGIHVWLRSPVRGAFLIADDDGFGVSMTTCRATMNAAWQVQRAVLRDGTPCFLLQTAAYGRYLALSPYSAPHGHRGRRAILRDFHEPQQRNIRWRAIDAGDDNDDVLLCTLEYRARYLRAHGRSTCSCITVEGPRSTMALWTVEQIPPRPAPPALPTPSTDMGVPTGLLQRRTRPVMDRQRTIRYMWANDEGNLLDTETFSFLGRSVFNLTNEVATRVGVDMFTITLCVHAGFHGRLTPLVVDLPRNEDPLDIVVLPNISPAAKALVHADIGPSLPGIDLLNDGAFVRLKCRLHGRVCYLHAKSDGLGVNLSPEASSLQEIWAVQHLVTDNDDFLLFRGAAYGRYFALMSEGQTQGSRFAQVKYEELKQSNLLWLATSLMESNEVNLHNKNEDTVLDIHWTVEAVPTSTTAPLLPAPDAKEEPTKKTRRNPERLIWHRQVDDTEITLWKALVFKGNLLSDLRREVSNDGSLILCVGAGRCGRLTPLVNDLPENMEDMEITIFTPGSRAAQKLRYPVINPIGV